MQNLTLNPNCCIYKRYWISSFFIFHLNNTETQKITVRAEFRIKPLDYLYLYREDHQHIFHHRKCWFWKRVQSGTCDGLIWRHCCMPKFLCQSVSKHVQIMVMINDYKAKDFHWKGYYIGIEYLVSLALSVMQSEHILLMYRRYDLCHLTWILLKRCNICIYVDIYCTPLTSPTPTEKKYYYASNETV